MPSYLRLSCPAGGAPKRSRHPPEAPAEWREARDRDPVHAAGDGLAALDRIDAETADIDRQLSAFGEADPVLNEAADIASLDDLAAVSGASSRTSASAKPNWPRPSATSPCAC